jgi:hypothetical protein
LEKIKDRVMVVNKRRRRQYLIIRFHLYGKMICENDPLPDSSNLTSKYRCIIIDVFQPGKVHG